MPVVPGALREWFNRAFSGCFNHKMSENRENDSALKDYATSPLKQTVDSLSKTPKGQISYDRQPLSPVIGTTLDNKPTMLLPESLFKREQSFEKPFERETSLPLAPIEEKNTHQQVRKGFQLPITRSDSSRPNQLTWQEELLLMRNTQQFDETTPVYNINSEMLLKLFERKEVQQLSVASNLQRRFQELEATSRQHADEECLRRKQELEARLVPKTESHVEFELITQRLQEEARHQRQQKEDQIDKRIKEIINQQERAQREKLQKQALEQQIAEAEKRRNSCSSKADVSWKKLHEILANCPEKNIFLQIVQPQVDLITEKKRELEQLVKQSGTSYLAIADRCESITKELEESVTGLERELGKHQEAVKAREIAEKIREVEASSVKSEPTDSSQSASSKEPVETKEHTTQEVQDIFPDCVFNDDLKLYKQLLQEVQHYTAIAESFKNDARFKADRFDLQRAIGKPINEISDQSGSHLLDKLERLKNLLRGNFVTEGTKSVKIPQHAGAFEFCMNLLASKMVHQAEEVVNVNPKAAFPIAAIIVELWIEFPIFGKLVLGYFYKQCPLLVPYYISQKEGQTNEEYYQSLGYRYSSDGKVELQPAFLKRMSGLVRLYAAVIISTPRNNQPHPHGLESAWHYLSSLLNLTPRSDITACVLAEFLTVVGNAMSREFGRQFQKMLHFICKEYFTMIRNVTPQGVGGGSTSRLEGFLQESIRNGGIPPPAGQLPPRFW